MTMEGPRRHQFPMPTDVLMGRWRVETATVRPARSGSGTVTWSLDVVHLDTDRRVAALLAWSKSERTYRVGQEIEGRIERRKDGYWFRRTYPGVRRAG
jgi:hypothetical protein